MVTRWVPHSAQNSHGAFEVLARELLGLPGDVAEAGRRHRDEGIGRAARDVLALAAMTLGLHHRIAFGHVPVGRSKSPGYGHLKLPHLMIAVSAAEQQ
ncbi:hypothetical protein AB7M74_000953 [Bradyrhizobium japonicum]